MQIGIFECTGMMGQDFVHPYIQSTTVLCDYDRGFTLLWIYRACVIRAIVLCKNITLRSHTILIVSPMLLYHPYVKFEGFFSY